MEDITYMDRAIVIAKQGGKHTQSNPNVGCIIVYNSRVIGEGYHQRYGEAHAEVNAFNSIAEADKQYITESTVYVTLEPCSHFGKTPPCADLIVQHRAKRVVVGCQDPSQKVSGKGIAKLRQAGIDVVVLNTQEYLDLIRPFVVFQTEKRPYIILKFAQSIEGYVGNHEKQIALSNQYTNILTHKWRSEVDAILVGTQTVLTDNPSLTTRNYPGVSPLRITFDYNLILDNRYTLLKDEHPTWILNATRNETIGNKRWITIPKDENLLGQILQKLFEEQKYLLMIEGGANTIQKFLNARLWDEARVISTATHLNEGIRAPRITGKLVSTVKIDGDTINQIHKE